MLLINVTQDHINKGSRGQCRNCPIALALLDNGFENVAVFEGVIDTYHKEYGYWYYYIPPELQEIINNYDKTGKMDPLEFELKNEA